jgi:general stress protein CsbA
VQGEYRSNQRFTGAMFHQQKSARSGSSVLPSCLLLLLFSIIIALRILDLIIMHLLLNISSDSHDDDMVRVYMVCGSKMITKRNLSHHRWSQKKSLIMQCNNVITNLSPPSIHHRWCHISFLVNLKKTHHYFKPAAAGSKLVATKNSHVNINQYIEEWWLITIDLWMFS